MLRQSRSLVRLWFLPRLGVFGLALVRFVGERVEWEQSMASCHPLPCFPGDHLPLISDPFKLLIAAGLMLADRWWSNLIAFMVSGWHVYQYTYLTMSALSAVSKSPIAPSSTFERWLEFIALQAPHQGVSLLISFPVLILSGASLISFVCRRREFE